MGLKKKSLNSLKKILDKLVSEYVRKRGADFRGYVACVSCGTRKHYSEQQCGHYNSRSHLSTRWDIRNCHVQCVGCNLFKKGNYPAYTAYLLENYGQKWLETLIRDGQRIKKWTVYDLEKEIEHFKNLIKTL